MQVLTIDLKWSLWSVAKEHWDDHAPGVWEKLEDLHREDTVTVHTAPRKEIRFGTVEIERKGNGSWSADVHFYTEWDNEIEGVPDDALPRVENGSPGVGLREYVIADTFTELMDLIDKVEASLIEVEKAEWKEIQTLYDC